MIGGAFLAFARMMIDIIVFVIGFTVKTKMIGSEKPWEGITSMVMITYFDEDDLFISGWTFEDDLVGVIHGKDDDLMLCEMTLKGGEFG